MNSLCVWKYDNDSFDTECGQKHYFVDGGPVENDYTFCPYCGGQITPLKTMGGDCCKDCYYFMPVKGMCLLVDRLIPMQGDRYIAVHCNF